MRVCNQCGAAIKDAGWRCSRCNYEPCRRNGFISFVEETATDPKSYDPAYFDEIVRLEEQNFWFRSRNKLILHALQGLCPADGSFLEIGCGTGFVLSAVRERFPRIKISGGDRYPDGLAHAARRLGETPLYQLDTLHIPFVDEFDILGAFDVLEHVQEDGEALSAMFRAIKKGGYILLTVPQHPFLWSVNDDVARHVRRYRRRELIEKAVAAGFNIVLCSGFISLLFPFMVASRALLKRGAGPEVAFSELKQPPLLNAAFERVLDVERLLIRAGIRFPFGGSLLLVGRKV